MKKSMFIGLFAAVAMVASVGCASNGSVKFGGGNPHLTSGVTHSHRHSHRGVPRHHDGTYHKVARVHKHSH